MTRRRLWLHVIAGIGGAASMLILIDVPPPTAARLSTAAAACLGVLAGLALFAVLAQELPPLPMRRPAGRWLVRLAFVVTWATVEEILWRWFVLGVVAAAAGWPLALAASTLGFATAHRVGKPGHLATGMTFGAVYLSSGRLLAAIVAHTVYNLVLADALSRAPLRAGPT